MFDTMTLTKAGGALFGALLVFLLIAWAGDELFTNSYKGVEQAYVIDTGDDQAAADEPEDKNFDEIFALADASAGERLWRQCSACHALDADRHGTGPSLYDIVDREVGAIDGFRYSGAMAGLDGAWSRESLYAFIENPRGYLPGTSMAYGGMRRSEDRANLIAYIESATN